MMSCEWVDIWPVGAEISIPSSAPRESPAIFEIGRAGASVDMAEVNEVRDVQSAEEGSLGLSMDHQSLDLWPDTRVTRWQGALPTVQGQAFELEDMLG